MALPRNTITRASRLMLPAHGIFSIVLGMTFLVQSPLRRSPSLDALHRFWSIDATGVSLTIGGIGILAAYAIGHRDLLQVFLAGGVVAYLAISVLFAVGAAMSPVAPISAVWWPLYVAICHLASLISVAFEERPTEAA